MELDLLGAEFDILPRGDTRDSHYVFALPCNAQQEQEMIQFFEAKLNSQENLGEPEYVHGCVVALCSNNSCPSGPEPSS